MYVHVHVHVCHISTVCVCVCVCVQIHPVYPKENPSSVLPPFPDINKLRFIQDIPKDKVSMCVAETQAWMNV